MLLEQEPSPVAARVGKAIVVGNGRCPDRDGLPAGALEGARLVIAADGGVRSALALGLAPDRVVGDGDSLAAAELTALAQRRIPFRRVPTEKDHSDLELAVREAFADGVAEIVIVGALDGARVEHVVANMLLLASPELAGVDLALVDERSTIRALRAVPGPVSLEVAGRVRDFVSLFPLGSDVEEVSTRGLRYALDGEPLLAGTTRGLSNELLAATATVTARGGVVLVVHTRRDKTEEEEADGTT